MATRHQNAMSSAPPVENQALYGRYQALNADIHPRDQRRSGRFAEYHHQHIVFSWIFKNRYLGYSGYSKNTQHHKIGGLFTPPNFTGGPENTFLRKVDT